MFGQGLQLVLNDSESRSPDSNGAFTFEGELAAGADFEVAVARAPVDETCVVQGGTGTVNGNVRSIRVRCSRSKPLLRAISHFGRVTLEWDADGPVDVIYSSDPDCDWDNYAICANGTLLLDREDKLVLRQRDGLTLNENYFFVIEQDGIRSRQAGAAPWVPGVAGGVLGGLPAVNTMVHHNGRVYIGGQFDTVQPPGDGSAVFNPASGAMIGALHQLDRDDNVYAAASDGDGGWFVGGNFSGIAGSDQEMLARIRRDGSLDSSWRPVLTGHRVSAIAVHEGRVFVAGNFNTVNGAPRSDLAALDAETGELLDWPENRTYFSGTTESSQIIVVDDRVLVSGDGLSYGGERRDGVIAFDLETGALLDWNSTENEARFQTPEVHAMAVIGDAVFVGGEFEVFGGQLRSNIASLDLQTGNVTSWNPSPDDIVTGLANRNGKLIVGGHFSEISGSFRDGLAAYDARSEALLPFVVGTGSIGNRIQKMTMVGDQLVVAGSMGDARDWLGTSDNWGLWLVDADSGSIRDRIIESAGYVNVIAGDGAGLYVGGGSAGGERRRNVAAFNAATGELSAWSPGLTGEVHAIIVADESIFVGGHFNGAFPQNAEVPMARQHLAEFDAATGALFEWFPTVRGNTTGNSINALAVIDANLLVGGDFYQINNIQHASFVAFDLKSSERVLTDGYPIAARPIVAMHANDDMLYLIGSVGRVGSAERYKLAAFDITAGELLDWEPEITGSVTGLALDADRIFVGGAFQSVADFVRPHLAAFDADTGDLEAWIPDSPTASTAIVVDGAVLYSAGFSKIESFDTVTGARLPFERSMTGAASHLLTIGDTIYIGGQFRSVDGKPRRGLAAFDMVTGDAVW